MILAFIKRRWVLLTAAIGIFACAFINLAVFSADTWALGVLDSSICVHYNRLDGVDPDFFADREPRFHAPNFGSLPFIMSHGANTGVNCPLWIPLGVIIGWIVLREMRRKEKRGNECSTADPSN